MLRSCLIKVPKCDVALLIAGCNQAEGLRNKLDARDTPRVQAHTCCFNSPRLCSIRCSYVPAPTEIVTAAPITNDYDDDDDDVSFYNSTASTWTLVTERTTWESNYSTNKSKNDQSKKNCPELAKHQIINLQD